ncbi:MAG: BrnA antitoxin family protein [Hoeflea sp.]|uniref:BrnA antitoxin family protein n=1 Tax=Hoeflea sp. TaxID=1940281 RepID=UPI001D9A6E21|nr:BrnA antitoxin family protein [Hoeflea sp.]MBU4527765.1 BrnA antitoxin family protein [Alphaproteobacteria bacterium]MBU4546200.1 BrnA antitoxin family protein [Alphaproteobacteria bacterium]MBU4553115.1 BrnA antitoxin family protein [Alphaproteobacteria bacterium]MBV1724187.1 BrnA antitoxin family protein [Hoeflea sp.]MBV1759872.1 BrnA antitoxin family protein [Hoeflea sp.]
MSSNKPPETGKQFPRFDSDAEAERFVDTADLSEYDLSQFKPMRFEIEKKTKQINLRMPESLVDALKARAKQRNIPYQRLIREAIENALR